MLFQDGNAGRCLLTVGGRNARDAIRIIESLRYLDIPIHDEKHIKETVTLNAKSPLLRGVKLMDVKAGARVIKERGKK